MVQMLLAEGMLLCSLFWAFCWLGTGSDEKNIRNFSTYPDEVQKIVKARPELAQREDNPMSTNTPNEKGTPQSRTYTVNDIAAILGIGRASAYKLANSGLFKTIRIGNMIRISRKSFEDWLKAEGLDE